MYRFALPLSLLLVAVLLIGCTSTTPGAASREAGSASPAAETSSQSITPSTKVGTPPRVEVLRLAGGDYGSGSPFNYSRGPGFCRMSLIFDTLVWKDSSGEIIPWLAESWKASDDGLNWTIKIRDGARWHDGKPLTVDDVAFTFRYFGKNPNPWTQAAVDMVKAVETAEDRTVRVTLSRPYAPFLRNVLGAMPIIPSHIWQKVDDPLKYTDKQSLVGSGPYRLASYNKAEGSYLYEANDDFWLGPPYVKRIELIPVGDEALAIKQGQIHAASVSGVGSATAADLMKALRDDPKLGVISAPGEWNLVLYFNMEKGPPYNDKAFRQAIAYSLDLQKMVDQVLFGDGTAGVPGRLPESNPWSNPKTPTYPYNVEKAKQLLESSGYLDRNGDGLREMPNGKPLKLQLLFGDLSSSRPAEMVKSWLADVGIEVTLKSVDRATLDQMTTEGQYEMAITGYGGMAGDPDFLRTNYSSRAKAKRFTRVYGYSNERFEELAAKQIETSDEAVRRKMVDEMQSILGEDVASIPLYYQNNNLVFDKTVFDAWYFTPGGIGSGVPMAWNKQAFITGEKTGLKIKGR